MKQRIREICNTHATHYQDKIVQEWTIEKDTKNEIFTEAYASVRSNRYCSGYRIEFEDPAIQQEFQKWQKTNITIEMYYGGGTVD